VDWINLTQSTIQLWVVLITLVQDQLHKAQIKFTLEQTMKAHRYMRLCCQQHALVAYPWDILQEGNWETETAWTDEENLAPTGIGTRIIQPIPCHYRY